MSSPLVFVRDGRTLPFIPVTVAAMEAIRAAIPKRRPFAIATYMALLEFANEDRADRVAVSQRDLFQRAGMSRSTVQTALADLQTAGVLQVHERIHSNARVENEYVVIEPAERTAIHDTPARDTGDPRPSQRQRTQEVRQEEPTASLSTDKEASEEPGTDLVLLDAPWSRARAEEGKNGVMPVPHNGKRCSATLVKDAVDAVDYFGRATGQRLRPFTASGKKTAALSRVLTAMQDYPEVRTIYRRMVDAAVAAPWWDGIPGTGVVFGPEKVQEYIQLAEGHRPATTTRGLTPSGRAIAKLLAANPAG